MVNIAERLKAATADLHYRIERAVPLLEGGVTSDSYRAYLAALLGFYEPVEQALTRLAWPLDLRAAARLRATLLVADLRALRLSEEQIRTLPRCDDLPKLEGAAEGFGCLYALEGTTHDGRVLQHHVERHLGLTASAGATFLACYGVGLAALWRAFHSVLAGAAPWLVEERIIVAARTTFSKLEAWLWSRRR